MYIQVKDNITPYNTSVNRIVLRCPECRKEGTLDPIQGVQHDMYLNNQKIYIGQRSCPNPSCNALIFFASRDGKILVSYPAERIDFDPTGIPDNIVSALKESIICHANECYIAAAIMVRKTLEELCHTQSATGSNLYERLKALGTKIVLPSELMSGLDDLRLLGNDAAHIESQVYYKISKEETGIGIIFAKEVLKAVYQYSNLLDQLRSLKKS